MMNFEAIFQSQTQIKSLLTGGSKFGVCISKHGATEYGGNVVSVGTVILEDLPYYSESCVPKGYEEQNNTQSFKSFCQKISISWSSSLKAVQLGIQSRNSFIKIKGYQIFSCASTDSKMQPILSIESDGAEDHNILPGEIFQKLTLDSALNFNLKFKIGEDFEGNLHRFVVFQLELHESIDDFAHRITTLHVGLMILGCVIHTGIKSEMLKTDRETQSQQLSVEARSFVPILTATFFDIPVFNVFTFQYYHKDLIGLNIPFRYGKIISVITPYLLSIVTPEMTALYLRAYRENALERVIIVFELHTTMFKFIANEYPTSANVNQKTPQQHLHTIGKLIILEELQRSVDITDFDIVCARLSFEEKKVPTFDPVYQMLPSTLHKKVMLVKLKIVGSSENRPMISLGDTVRLRPVPESGSILGMFEMQGIVVSYQLSSEEVC